MTTSSSAGTSGCWHPPGGPAGRGTVLGLDNRTQAAILAHQLGLTDDGPTPA
ncbi:hypothetical protein AB0F71_23850 [Kitasatospora sp. NPDC028055]|uniref:hypothetical protein n=1 Tax=Kitasatospora sp. NPDC028055 TaxID=3155653 RepID=UPI0033CEF584